MNFITLRFQKWQGFLFDQVARLNPHLGLDKRAEQFASLFEGCLDRQSHVLDIGGRWGFYAEPLLRRGHELTVLDVVKPGFQKAPVVIYDGRRIPFEDKSFDASLLVTVLHHMPEPEEVIREARRVTKKTLIVVEDLYHHALGRWWTVLRDRLYNFQFFGHPCHFKKSEEWIEFFEREGFSLMAEHKIYTWLAGLRILNGIFIFNVEEPA